MSEDNKDFPTAVAAPEGDIVPLTLTMVGNLLAMSRQSPRKRVVQRLHKTLDAGTHRMFNALQPGTYIPPHRHLHPVKSETILVISGSVLFVRFTEDGGIADHTLLQPGTESFGVDVAPHVYHTYVALKPDTLIFEVKDGPFEKERDKDIPAWAPAEDAQEAEAYMLGMLKDLSERATAQADAAKAEAEGNAAGEKERDRNDEA
ncbi:cupin fold metalloprotein, WbuC family [Pseudodesulfovibrio sp. F-1]|uniref:Cupin fold metalloprotein, WbuC family n=1 Tax=Pseudodesulfovibrio alkaliphilus TaxID=2661613 RepID=A0A7K1KM17_9BACT|nr:WbuC family cupin fold metalloprotein [Pseudodesulfovibrio alkaliphilus]MUM77105.1 cupin fold metalloprotein, WbuC family [Pseudodesulfovibrio alkaliphilus]